MPLTSEQTNTIAREFMDYLSARPLPGSDPIPFNKADLMNAIAAVDARVDTVLPSVLNQVPQTFSPFHRRTLVRLILRERAS